MAEPHMAAVSALDQARLHIDELSRQRHEWETRWRRAVNDCHTWESKYQAAVVERDQARMERDVARAQAQSHTMSP